MRLHAYLTRNDIRIDDFAAALGISSLSSIYRYLRGERVPCAKIMQRIHELTAGQVTSDDFYRSREWWLTRQARAKEDAVTA